MMLAQRDYSTTDYRSERRLSSLYTVLEEKT